MAPSRIPMRLVRHAFESADLREMMVAQQTHDFALGFTAKIVGFSQDVEHITAIGSAALPDGKDGTRAELPGMVQSALAKGFGGQNAAGPSSEEDEEEELKGKPTEAQVLLKLIKDVGAKLFHDEQRRSFMSISHTMGGNRHWSVRSTECKSWCRQLFYKATKKPITSNALSEVIDTLEASALFEGEQRKVSLRIGGDEKGVTIDMGRPDGKVVLIDGKGWTIGVDPKTIFYRSPGMREMPEPSGSGGLNELRDLLGINDDQWLLLLAFLINALRPIGPYLILFVEGEQGSGKSKLCAIIKRIIDPNVIDKMRLPEHDRDLMIMAKEFHLLVFDNVSGMKGDLSDALCALATGGGVATRRLYTDDELQIFNFHDRSS